MRVARVPVDQKVEGINEAVCLVCLLSETSLYLLSNSARDMLLVLFQTGGNNESMA